MDQVIEKKMFLNKGMFLITNDEKSPKTYKESVNIKIFGYFQNEKLEYVRVYLSFDYDVYTLLKCEITEDQMHEITEKIDWAIPFDQFPVELSLMFDPKANKNSMIDILYTITPFNGKMTFHEITQSQRLYLFTLTFVDADPAECFSNAQIRYNDVRNDLASLDKQMQHIYKYLHEKNPKLLEMIKSEK